MDFIYNLHKMAIFIAFSHISWPSSVNSVFVEMVPFLSAVQLQMKRYEGITHFLGIFQGSGYYFMNSIGERLANLKMCKLHFNLDVFFLLKLF